MTFSQNSLAPRNTQSPRGLPSQFQWSLWSQWSHGFKLFLRCNGLPHQFFCQSHLLKETSMVNHGLTLAKRLQQKLRPPWDETCISVDSPGFQTKKDQKSSSARNKTGWWFQPIWKILVQLDHFPRGENKKIFETTTQKRPLWILGRDQHRNHLPRETFWKFAKFPINSWTVHGWPKRPRAKCRYARCLVEINMRYKMVEQSTDLTEIPCWCPSYVQIVQLQAVAFFCNQEENLCGRQDDHAPLSLLFLRRSQILIWNEQLTRSTICLKTIWKIQVTSLEISGNTTMQYTTGYFLNTEWFKLLRLIASTNLYPTKLGRVLSRLTNVLNEAGGFFSCFFGDLPKSCPEAIV